MSPSIFCSLRAKTVGVVSGARRLRRILSQRAGPARIDPERGMNAGNKNVALRVRGVAGGSDARQLQRDAGPPAVNRIGSGENAPHDCALRAGSNLPAAVRSGG